MSRNKKLVKEFARYALKQEKELGHFPKIGCSKMEELEDMVVIGERILRLPLLINRKRGGQNLGRRKGRTNFNTSGRSQ